MKNYIFIILMSVAFIACNAQEIHDLQNINTDQLVNTKWKLQNTGSHDYTIEFTNNTVKTRETFPRINKEIDETCKYYISSTKPTSFKSTSFDNSLVGKKREGCYLVVCSSESEYMNVFGIMSLNSGSLIMYLYLDHPDSMYAGGVEHIWKYKRVSDSTNNTTGTSNGSITPVSSNWGNNIGSQTQQNSTSQTGTTTNSTGSRGRR
ncbi:MAG: hypothetical protein II844_09170 [Prevotella sp.]|nr:hypothetical protein [Prevotella sp.]